MCGIWGFNSKDGKGFNEKHVEAMIKRADERGGHSYGFYGIKKNGKHIYFKEEGRAKPVLIMEMIKDCIAVIGQSRLASSASIDLFNSQPLVQSDYVVVHNGNIPNYQEIMSEANYTPYSDLDSEAIIPLLRKGALNITGSVLAFKISEYDFNFIYYSNCLPLVKLTEGEVDYYCSKQWVQKY